jgi:hypothetical protein
MSPEAPPPPPPPGDDDPRVVPFYALTRGRTQPSGPELPWEAIVTTTGEGLRALPRQQFEQARILELCRWPVSLAEVASELGVPVGVARVLVSDLRAEGLLDVNLPRFTDQGRPAVEVLERLLTGLKRGA